MFSWIRRRLTFTNVAVTLALVFAMSGGAYAAGKYLINSTKQINPKVLKQLKGAKGAPGAPGATGAAGPAGPAGPQGPAGPAGVKGETGSTGLEGHEGKEGPEGPEGVCSTANCVLPKGVTETGTWSWAAAMGTEHALMPITFNIRLPGELEESQVHFVGTTGDGSTCPGTAASPSALPGNLCVYEEFAAGVAETTGGHAVAFVGNPGSNLILFHVQGAGTTGAVVLIPLKETERSEGFGTWAVTAP